MKISLCLPGHFHQKTHRNLYISLVSVKKSGRFTFGRKRFHFTKLGSNKFKFLLLLGTHFKALGILFIHKKYLGFYRDYKKIRSCNDGILRGLRKTKTGIPWGLRKKKSGILEDSKKSPKNGFLTHLGFHKKKR